MWNSKEFANFQLDGGTGFSFMEYPPMNDNTNGSYISSTTVQTQSTTAFGFRNNYSSGQGKARYDKNSLLYTRVVRYYTNAELGI